MAWGVFERVDEPENVILPVIVTVRVPLRRALPETVTVRVVENECRGVPVSEGDCEAEREAFELSDTLEE